MLKKITFFTLLFLAGGASAATYTDAKELMRYIDRMWRSDSSHAVMSMMVKTDRYQRTMKMEAWSKGKDHSLFVILSPKKDKGIATLKAGENIWNYLPKINRVTKIPPSMMSGSWMGSHFTNDDLVQESQYEDDFDTSLTFTGKRDGRDIYEVTSIPKENSAVVWDKIIMLIDQQTLVPIESSYYDDEGVMVRVMSFDQIEKKGGRHIPMRMTLTPLDTPDESTVIEYHSIEFDLPIKDRLFSIQSLQKRR